MAFGFGNTVNPQLGATNYSGFLQGALSGAQMQAQGGAAIGQGIAQGLQAFTQGIDKYQKKKEEEETKRKAVDFAVDAVKRAPGLFPNVDPNNREAIAAGVDTVGAAAFLQMEQAMAKAKEDQDAAAYAGQLSQGKGMDYLRGNFRAPFRATPFSESARIKGQNIYDEGESARLGLQLQRQAVARSEEAQIDKRIEDEARSLAADLDAGFDFDPNVMGVQGFTPQENNRLFTSPIVMAAMEKQKSKRLGESVSSSVSNISSGKSSFLDEVKNFNGGDVFTFWKAAQDFVPESLARQINIGGVKGVLLNNNFFPSDEGGLNAPAYANATNAAADYIRDNGIRETSELSGQDRTVLSQLYFDSLRARNLKSLPTAGEGKDPFDVFLFDTFNRISSQKGNNGDESKSGEPRAGGPTAPRLPPTSANGVFPTAPPPAGQTAQPMGQPTSLAERLRVDMPSAPLNVRMVTPISYVGPVTDSVTGKVIGAIGPRLEPTPANGVFQTGTAAQPVPAAQTPTPAAQPSAQGGGFPMERKVTYGAGAAYAAYKAAPATVKTAQAVKALAVRYGPSVGNAVKTLGRFGKALAGRAVPPVAISMFADTAIGDMITFAANTAAKKSGSDLIEYNKGASEWLAESLAKSIYGPNSEQEITSKILDELSVVKNSDDLTDAEKQKSNAFLLELLNNVRSGDVSGVPERFRAL